MKKFKPILFSCFILGQSVLSRAQKKDILIQEIDRFAYPIDTNNYSKKEFLPDSVFANTSILALGESTHGTHEFFATKDYIIRNQVLNNNAKVIAIEADFCRMLQLNQYLLDNSKSIDKLRNLLYNSAIYQIYNTEELLTLLTWVKNYNLSKSNDIEKVKFFGLDMQTPYVIVQSIIDSLPQLKTADQNVYAKILELRDQSSSRDWAKLSKSNISSYKDLMDQISILARKIARQNSLRYILQFAELMKQSISLNEGFLGGGYAVNRDEFLAKTAVWVKENFVSDREKMLIWAHNDHIAHTKLGGSYRMGYFLRAQLKEQYYALSFVFDQGFVRAYDPSNNELKTFFYPSSTFSGSIEAFLKNARSSFYFLNVLEIKDPAIIDFFKQNKYQKNIGQVYSSNRNKTFLKLPVMECFDGLIFIKKTNAAVTLNMNE